MNISDNSESSGNSILDQLFSPKNSPSLSPVQVDSSGPAVEVSLGLMMAAQQAMNDGFSKPNSTSNLSRMEPGISGIMDAAHVLNTARDYASIIRGALIDTQMGDIKNKPTADDVFEGGIKRGSKVLIRVVEENADVSNKSWKDVVKGDIEGRKGVPSSIVFDKFSVSSISEPDAERHQIVETFGADIIYGFGRRPRQMRLTGQVLNGRAHVSVGGSIRSMDWKNAFLRQYESNYRLTACIRNRKRIMIYAQDTVYIGYLLDMNAFTADQSQGISQVNITFIMADRSFLNQNDSAIPGWINEYGRNVTDRTVPEALFKDSNVSDFFKEDISPEIDEAIKSVQVKINDLALKISRMGGSASVLDIINAAEKLSSKDSNEVVVYKGLSMHQIYKDLGTFDAPISFIIDSRGSGDIIDTSLSLDTSDYTDESLGYISDSREQSFRYLENEIRNSWYIAEELIKNIELKIQLSSTRIPDA